MNKGKNSDSDLQSISKIGLRFGWLRLNSGMLVDEIIIISGIEVARLKEIEEGTADTTVHELVSLCLCYNIRLSDILNDPPDKGMAN